MSIIDEFGPGAVDQDIWIFLNAAEELAQWGVVQKEDILAQKQNITILLTDKVEGCLKIIFTAKRTRPKRPAVITHDVSSA
jgi:hypothetical protein